MPPQSPLRGKYATKFRPLAENSQVTAVWLPLFQTSYAGSIPVVRSTSPAWGAYYQVKPGGGRAAPLAPTRRLSVPGDALAALGRARDDFAVGRKQEPDVRPDGRVVVGLVTGPIAPCVGLGLQNHPAQGVVVGLATAGSCVVGYLTCLYGRNWYERWLVARHTYRPDDH
jgi:hypothetical protein